MSTYRIKFTFCLQQYVRADIYKNNVYLRYLTFYKSLYKPETGISQPQSPLVDFNEYFIDPKELADTTYSSSIN
jgi:hypothetical protein